MAGRKDEGQKILEKVQQARASRKALIGWGGGILTFENGPLWLGGMGGMKKQELWILKG